jgi:hypothetical protein
MIHYNSIIETKAFTYEAYRKLINELLAEGKTTGSDHSEAMLHYTKMNIQRMNRVEKTTVINDQLRSAIENVRGSYTFLVITEGWCGDAAQIVPVIQHVVKLAPAHFNLKLVLRDENLPLIDSHLTNGGRAIPVLLVLNELGELVMPKWGPRPEVLQILMKQWKEENADMTVISEKLHAWYAKDKTQAIQEELLTVVKKLA